MAGCTPVRTRPWPSTIPELGLKARLVIAEHPADEILAAVDKVGAGLVLLGLKEAFGSWQADAGQHCPEGHTEGLLLRPRGKDLTGASGRRRPDCRSVRRASSGLLDGFHDGWWRRWRCRVGIATSSSTSMTSWGWSCRTPGWGSSDPGTCSSFR